VLEPIKCNIPTLFGPYMDKQQSITEIALSTGYARQTTLSALSSDVGELLQAPQMPAPLFPDIAENTWLPIKALDLII